jgi:multicomponent Na+:H+ antiporter subunit E
MFIIVHEFISMYNCLNFMREPMNKILIFRRGMIFLVWTGVWLIMTREVASLLVGIPAAFAAAWLSPLPSSRLRLRPSRLPALFFAFLIDSVRGGVDVARRALKPGLLPSPTVLKYPLALPEGLPRILMANMVSLLPGTFSWKLEDDKLVVHILDRELDVLPDLRRLEARIAAAFYQEGTVDG